MKTLKCTTALITLLAGIPILTGLTIWFIGIPLFVQIGVAFYPDMVLVYLMILLVLVAIICGGIVVWVTLDMLFEKYGWTPDDKSDRL